MSQKPIFSKFLDAMNHLSNEVNDREICKRLETLMLTSKDDLNPNSVHSMLRDPQNFDPREIPEPYTMYVKHFIYMVKRNEKLGIKKHQYVAPTAGKNTAANKTEKTKPTTRKAATSRTNPRNKAVTDSENPFFSDKND
ncbi:MAG: hypothetical protein AAF518_01295 [Spirochaetota bacterium]